MLRAAFGCRGSFIDYPLEIVSRLAVFNDNAAAGAYMPVVIPVGLPSEASGMTESGAFGGTADRASLWSRAGSGCPCVVSRLAVLCTANIAHSLMLTGGSIRPGGGMGRLVDFFFTYVTYLIVFGIRCVPLASGVCPVAGMVNTDGSLISTVQSSSSKRLPQSLHL